MYIGIDLGTSGIKSVLMNAQGKIIDSVSHSLVVSRPQPLWSEQNPHDWWIGLCTTLDELSKRHPLAGVKAIGLSGQMHGATLLDADNSIVRPCILWNDGRSAEQCMQLEKRVTNCHDITGNLIMPGFTAPKLLWVQQFEPENFANVAKVLLPKDYLRLKLSGVYATDVSDASGTAWFDVAKRDWSEEMLAATGLSRHHMPDIYEGNQITSYLSQELATRWGMTSVAIVAGGGDNAAGAIGVGITKPGQAMLSLGTSGVYFVVSEGMKANPQVALHAFCHALPQTWHSMSVMLSAASCLDWLAETFRYQSVAEMLSALEQSGCQETSVIFLPYLSGERTPHNDPNAQGAFFGLTMETRKEEWILAVLEGVAFGLADGALAVHSTQLIPETISLIGGGARSALWRQIICDVIGMPVTYREGGEVGPALGAARLARLAIEPDTAIEEICPQPRELERHSPNQSRHDYYLNKLERYRMLYQQIRPLN